MKALNSWMIPSLLSATALSLGLYLTVPSQSVVITDGTVAHFDVEGSVGSATNHLVNKSGDDPILFSKSGDDPILSSKSGDDPILSSNDLFAN